MLALQHSGASFDELVIWFVCTLEVFTVCHTCGDTFWSGAKIEAVVNLRVFVGTVQTEKPSTTDAPIARITPCIPINRDGVTCQH